MATSYYDMTGVLVLDKITPVIRALFGAFALDEKEFENGQVYIADISATQDHKWTCVHDNLLALAGSLGLDIAGIKPAAAEEVEAVISLLATHFKADGNTDLLNLIDHTDFDEDADLEAVFTLARAFDDGHGLKGFKTEAAWHSDRPRLFEFGGSGTFHGSHFMTGSSSRGAVNLGQTVDDALGAGDTDTAAKVLAVKVKNLIDGIQSTGVRADVRDKVMQLLAAESAAA